MYCYLLRYSFFKRKIRLQHRKRDKFVYTFQRHILKHGVESTFGVEPWSGVDFWSGFLGVEIWSGLSRSSFLAGRGVRAAGHFLYTFLVLIMALP